VMSLTSCVPRWSMMRSGSFKISGASSMRTMNRSGN
jgi:hypothetical protein